MQLGSGTHRYCFPFFYVFVDLYDHIDVCTIWKAPSVFDLNEYTCESVKMCKTLIIHVDYVYLETNICMVGTLKSILGLPRFEKATLKKR
jgi:hypothetical protein